MRISDWSSDVCSSDLLELVGGRVARIHQRVPRRVASSASSCSWRSRTICGGCGDQSKNTGTSRPSLSSAPGFKDRSAEHTSELQSLLRTSYAVLCSQTNKTLPAKPPRSLTQRNATTEP